MGVKLGKLERFETYENLLMKDSTYKISCCLVLMHNGKELLATPIARGLEELENVSSDSQPIDKCNVIIVLAICESKGWVLKTSKENLALLQGHIHFQLTEEAEL